MKRHLQILFIILGLIPGICSAQVNFKPAYAGYSWHEVNNFYPYFAAIDMAFLPNGNYIVAQHRGLLSMWDPNGGKIGDILDISDEVWSNGDAGLTSILVDPDFPTTPSVYLMYAVETEPSNPDTVMRRFGRITKYTLDANNNYMSVVPGSRKVLLGETWTEGILHESYFHASGKMQWGDDGTLLFSAGDAADFGYTPTTGTGIYGPGKFPESLNIRSMRAQSLDCYNGKITRIDRNTGLGLPTNPFYTGDGTDAKSKIWLYGLRNPWRFSVQRGTGAHTSFGTGPGIIWIGDVGLDSYEELNISSKEGGQNFGWPFYEGVISPLNEATYDGPIPWVPVEETTTFSLAFSHSAAIGKSYPEDLIGGITGASITDGFVYDYKSLDTFTEASPVPYTSILDNKYVFADWAQHKFFAAEMDSLSQLTDVDLVADGLIKDEDGIVNLTYSPADGRIYALAYWRLYRLDFDPAGSPPMASFTTTPDIGLLPLEVSLDASESSDPGNADLTFTWDFDDGTTAATTNPITNHYFLENRNYEVQLVVSTPDDRVSTATSIIYAGNVPPEPVIISPTSLTTYPDDGSVVSVHYEGTASDPDGPAPDTKWRVALRHNDHRHELQETFGLSGDIDIKREEENTFFLFEFFATDSRGYTVKVEQEVRREGELSGAANWMMYE